MTGAGAGGRFEIREVDPSKRADAALVARLHMQLLDFGPMAGLGEVFLRDFCYTVLIREGLLRAAVYDVDGQAAGFIAYTDRSITFHRDALHKYPFRVGWVLMRSIALDARMFTKIVRALRVIHSRSRETRIGTDPLAEVVAIGVLPEYRSPKFMRRTGRKISEELILHAARWFRERGLERMRLVVDADNLQTVLFYHGLGARVEPCEQAGVPVIHVWFDLGDLLRTAEGDGGPEGAEAG